MKLLIPALLFCLVVGCASTPTTRSVQIPDSDMYVSIPSKWGESNGYGKYDYISVNLPDGPSTCCKGFPDFKFEYRDKVEFSKQYLEVLARIKKNSPDTIFFNQGEFDLEGHRAYKLAYDSELRLTYIDFSHSSLDITNMNVFISTSKGVLVCSLSSSKDDYYIYKNKLVELCAGAVNSNHSESNSPNK